ncbi:MAG: DUF488 domain-containing protein [Bdellovibrionota bacterium]
MVKIKRAYEETEKGDGYRILIDRLWPRGIRKSKLILDEWAKELAPSSELRKSFGHDPDKWKEFQSRYRRELRTPEHRRIIEALARRARRRPLTLVYSAKDEEHNDAVVLKNVIAGVIKKLSA